VRERIGYVSRRETSRAVLAVEEGGRWWGDEVGASEAAGEAFGDYIGGGEEVRKAFLAAQVGRGRGREEGGGLRGCRGRGCWGGGC
jgi:hypothetical protein